MAFAFLCNVTNYCSSPNPAVALGLAWASPAWASPSTVSPLLDIQALLNVTSLGALPAPLFLLVPSDLFP